MKHLIPILLAVLLLSACDPPETGQVNPPPQTEKLPVFESSFEAVANMGVGWNLGNTLDSWWVDDTDGRDWKRWETGWGQPVTKPELMTMMKNAGFGAIRVPVTWSPHMDKDGNVYKEWMDRVNEIVDYVLDAGMYCIINVHHDTGADEKVWLVASEEDYAREKELYEGLWRQIALRFKDYDHRLLFESYNEMLDKYGSWCFASLNLGYDEAEASEAYTAINNYAQSFVDAVRSTGGNNAVRNLVVNTYGACNGSGNWNSHLKEPLRYMLLPSDKVEDHLIFQVHAYPLIDDIPSMEAEMEDMFHSLDVYLEAQGAPVIIGEWGTFSENPSQENLLYYADFFVRRAKEHGFGTFYWMTLSDGFARSIPAFSTPELARTIVQAWHGEGVGVFPAMDDIQFKYQVTYNSLWSEMNLHSGEFSLDKYIGVTFHLEETPASDDLHVKVYGDTEGKEQHNRVTGKETTVIFDPSIVGTGCTGVTLQYKKSSPNTFTVSDIAMICPDGSLEESVPSVFWGCYVEPIAL